MGSIEAAPSSVGYPLRGFRGVHSGRYRIIWRLHTLETGERVAEVVYVGIRSEGDDRDAYAEFERLFGLPGV
jgi:hypothetical protein